jgi:tRNA U34 5-carboxymethylaminomethyl modifying GTPase MnmE/TrmE
MSQALALGSLASRVSQKVCDRALPSLMGNVFLNRGFDLTNAEAMDSMINSMTKKTMYYKEQ